MATAAIKRAEPLFVRPGAPELDRVLRGERRPPSEREILLDALSRYVWFLCPAWLDHAGDSGALASILNTAGELGGLAYGRGDEEEADDGRASAGDARELARRHRARPQPLRAGPAVARRPRLATTESARMSKKDRRTLHTGTTDGGEQPDDRTLLKLVLQLMYDHEGKPLDGDLVAYDTVSGPGTPEEEAPDWCPLCIAEADKP